MIFDNDLRQVFNGVTYICFVKFLKYFFNKVIVTKVDFFEKLSHQNAIKKHAQGKNYKITGNLDDFCTIFGKNWADFDDCLSQKGRF